MKKYIASAFILFLFYETASTQLQHTFSFTARYTHNGIACDVAVDSNSTVFLADGEEGLRAYSYHGMSFTNTAHINDGGSANGVAVGPNGTVFLASGSAGLLAYIYSGYTSIDDDLSSIPKNYALLQNYPNPFNPTTNISYQIPVSSEIDLSIYNIFGQKVVTLVNKTQLKGTYKVEWDASGFASGIYIYRLKTNEGIIKSRKLVLLK
jgi:hypothetical protein